MIEELNKQEFLEVYSQCSHFENEEWEDNKVVSFMQSVDEAVGFMYFYNKQVYIEAGEGI